MKPHPWDPWDMAVVRNYSRPEPPKPKPQLAGMTRNWYELSIKELEIKKERMLNWLFIADQNDPNQKKMWRALGEVGEVLEIKKEAEKDIFLKTVIETLCI